MELPIKCGSAIRQIICQLSHLRLDDQTIKLHRDTQYALNRISSGKGRNRF